MPETTYENNRASRTGTYIIPKDWSKPSFKLEVKYRGATTYTDITSDCFSLTVMCAATVRQDAFNATLDNNSGKYNDLLLGGEWFRISYGYSSANTGAVIERFRGRLTSKFQSFSEIEGIKLQISGRAYPEFNERKITISFNATNIEEAISQVVAKYSDMSFTKPNLSTDTVTQTFVNETGFGVLRMLCERFLLEFYITVEGEIVLVDPSLAQFQHTDIGIGRGQNLMWVEEWGYDWNELKNRIKIHGKQEDYVIYYKYAEDASSQTNFWIKEEDIYDSTVTSDIEAIQRASLELEKLKTLDEGGRVAVVGMPTVVPGWKIYLNCPYVAQGYFVVRSCSHTFNSDSGYVTEFSLTSERKGVAHLIVERMRAEQGLRPPEEFDVQTNEAIVVDFQAKNLSYYSHSKTEVVNGKLQLVSGEVSGSCSVSVNFPGAETINNTSKCAIIISGDYLENCVVSVSNDSGLNSVSFAYEELKTFKDFAVSDNAHQVVISLADNDAGNKPVINKVGVFLVHA